MINDNELWRFPPGSPERLPQGQWKTWRVSETVSFASLFILSVVGAVLSLRYGIGVLTLSVAMVLWVIFSVTFMVAEQKSTLRKILQGHPDAVPCAIKLDVDGRPGMLGRGAWAYIWLEDGLLHFESVVTSFALSTQVGFPQFAPWGEYKAIDLSLPTHRVRVMLISRNRENPSEKAAIGALLNKWMVNEKQNSAWVLPPLHIFNKGAAIWLGPVFYFFSTILVDLTRDIMPLNFRSQATSFAMCVTVALMSFCVLLWISAKQASRRRTSLA